MSLVNFPLTLDSMQMFLPPQCEDLLRRDGDFLVRESQNSPGQFVLSGRHGGRIRHLLLVDPEGVVSRHYSNTGHKH